MQRWQLGNAKTSTTLRRSSVVITMLLLPAIVVSPAFARTPGQACAAEKTKAAGKNVLCAATCDEAAVNAGTTPSPLCAAKCRSRYHARWTQLEARGGCVTVNDEAAISSKIDAGLVTLETMLGLGGPSSCTAYAYRASGRRASCALRCHAKAMIRGAAVDTLCLHRCSDALALAVSKAEARADCLVAVSGVPLEDTIRAFVSDVIDELPGAPTTTTTTPATTTTTTLCTGCLRDVTGDGVRTWLMVGDSNTSFLACAYPEALQARHDPSEITVVNGGIFAASAAYWVQQGLLAPLLEQDRPDGVLIALGTNDVASTPPEYVVTYLLELFDQARAWCYDGGCAVAYVATIPPIYCPPNPIELNPQIDAVNALIRAVIPAPNVVDFDSWMPAVWDENYMWHDYDGIHLGCGGQAIRADVCDDVLAHVSD